MYATILMEQGVQLPKISALLGHESVNTTFEYYCEIMDEEGNKYDVWCKAKTNELLDISDDEVLKFSLDEGITPYDLEELLTNYL